MEVHFRVGHIDLQDLEEFDAIVCPTDMFCSGSGGLDEKIHRAAGPGLKAALTGKKRFLADVHITRGFELGADFIAHAVVPDRDEITVEYDTLYQCYNHVLTELGRTDIAGRHPETAVITLLGTGSRGWSYEESIDALWRAIITYHKQYRYFGSLTKLYVYCPNDIKCFLLDRYRQRASQAFFDRPETWGRRVGMGLWYALMVHFDNPKFNNIPLNEFIREIQRFFYRVTGKWIGGDTNVTVEQWAEFCSGVIDSSFAELAIPVLCSNLCKLGFPTNRDSVSFLLPVTLREHQLTLPFELLSDLTDLRKKASELTEMTKVILVPGQPYYLTKFHYRNAPDLIVSYSLDVERAADSHYHFSEEVAAGICRQLGWASNAIGAALGDYLKQHGGAALELLMLKNATTEFHYH